MSDQVLTIEQRIKKLSDHQFKVFYRYLLHYHDISRHSSPEFQIRLILATDPQKLELFLETAEGVNP